MIQFVGEKIECDMKKLILISVVFILLLWVLYFGTGIPSVFTRLKYLESNDTVKPPFKIAYSSVIDVPKGFDFGHLRTEYNETNI